MHFVHHSRHQPETDSNYASGLSLWDRLFRSFRLRENPEEITLGLGHWETREWRSLPGMLSAPFHKRSLRSRRNLNPLKSKNRSYSSGFSFTFVVLPPWIFPIVAAVFFTAAAFVRTSNSTRNFLLFPGAMVFTRPRSRSTERL